MEKETISKAAEGYVMASYPEGDDADRYTLGKKVGGLRGFMAGAEWRIKSVWHKTTPYDEEVQCNVKVIVHCKNDLYFFGRFGAAGFSPEHISFISTSGIGYSMSDILEYAYLEDLIPNRKEDEA